MKKKGVYRYSLTSSFGGFPMHWSVKYQIIELNSEKALNSLQDLFLS